MGELPLPALRPLGLAHDDIVAVQTLLDCIIAVGKDVNVAHELQAVVEPSVAALYI